MVQPSDRIVVKVRGVELGPLFFFVENWALDRSVLWVFWNV